MFQAGVFGILAIKFEKIKYGFAFTHTNTNTNNS
jgi:hypothetical protein